MIMHNRPFLIRVFFSVGSPQVARVIPGTQVTLDQAVTEARVNAQRDEDFFAGRAGEEPRTVSVRGWVRV